MKKHNEYTSALYTPIRRS